MCEETSVHDERQMIMKQDIEENEKVCVAVGGDVRINPIC